MKMKKPVTLITALILLFTGFTSSINAVDMDDLKARQQELNNNITANEKKLADLGAEAKETEEYLRIYDEKMFAQEELVKSLDTEIAEYEAQAAAVADDIAHTEDDLKSGIEDFRKRLRVMYMSRTDSLASVLTGSGSFYDILVSMEFIERVSERDNELITNLNDQISELNIKKADLEAIEAELNITLSEAKLEAARLAQTYKEHQETLEMKQALIDDYTQRGEQLEAESAKNEAEIEAFIIAEQKRLEEERKAREAEEERKRREAEEAGKRFEADNSKNYTSYSNTGFIWPVPSVHSTSDGYGNRWIIEEQRNNFHKGLDITKPGCKGAEIVASAGGTVIQAGNNNNGYGNCVIIDHGNSISTLYAHMSETAVSVGQVVEQGKTIGYIGNTGNSYGYHLHFEVRVNGQHTDPVKYIGNG
jgi:murein DD-endopeptidase MepM/ murein hydrolase activator NlpD